MANPKLFTVSLQVAQDSYSATGETVIEALDKLKPPHIKARGLFVVKYGKKQSEFQMIPALVKKLFINNTFKEIFQKRMISLLK